MLSNSNEALYLRVVLSKITKIIEAVAGGIVFVFEHSFSKIIEAVAWQGVFG